MSLAINAQHTKFYVDTSDDASAAVFVRIKGMKTFSGFDGQASDIDTTDMDSDAKESSPGLMDNGTFSFDVNRNLTDPGQAALLAMQKSQATRRFILQYPDGTGDTFKSYVQTFPISGGVDAVMTSSIKMKITGAVNPASEADIAALPADEPEAA
jgi:hypothetical protein